MATAVTVQFAAYPDASIPYARQLVSVGGWLIATQTEVEVVVLV